jgi:hypothetical protein
MRYYLDIYSGVILLIFIRLVVKVVNKLTYT